MTSVALMSDLDSPITPRTHRLTKLFAVSSSVLVAADLIILFFRIHLRLRRARRLWIDDWLIMAGFVFTTVCWAIELAAVAGFADVNTISISPYGLWKLGKLAFFSYTFWSLAICCIKCSILFTLHRLRDALWWRSLIRGLMVSQIAFTIGDCSFQWAQYNVLTSMGCATNPENPCQGIYTILTYVEASFQISTDLIISLLPATFLAQLRRPLWEKILISLLMSLCLLACALSIRKTMVARDFSDPTQNIGDLNVAYFTFNCSELFVAVIAACLFGLKASIYRLLERLGFNVAAIVHRTYETADDLPDFNLTTESTTSEKEKYVPMDMI